MPALFIPSQRCFHTQFWTSAWSTQLVSKVLTYRLSQPALRAVEPKSTAQLVRFFITISKCGRFFVLQASSEATLQACQVYSGSTGIWNDLHVVNVNLKFNRARNAFVLKPVSSINWFKQWFSFHIKKKKELYLSDMYLAMNSCIYICRYIYTHTQSSFNTESYFSCPIHS